MAGNQTLNAAAKAKQDEFYTRLVDIENELRHYTKHFAGKVVLCNCDDPQRSEFVKYFAQNFHGLGLKKLIATCLADSDAPARLTEFRSPDDFTSTQLDGGGDFRSPECLDALKEADIVVTNPPFSLFRQYVKQLVDFDKKFLVIGNLNAVTYKEIFPLIMQNKIWLGYGFKGGDPHFKVPDDYEERATRFWIDEHGQKWRSFGNLHWFTNLDISKRHEDIALFKRYAQEPELFPRYDNYDAIEVSKTVFIPADYYGVMGVPITFLDKHNPAQFDIVGLANHGKDNEFDLFAPKIGGKKIFKRILIQRRRN